jgi:hypothetical protein
MGINLDKIVNDLLLTIRGSRISQSEVISKKQVEEWVHQYRALLLKRDLDKDYRINPDYIQEISNLELEMVERSEENTIGSDCYVTRTVEPLPKTIDFSHKSGLVFIGTYTGKQFQLVPYNRSYWQQFKKYTASEKLAFLRNNFLYITNNELLKYVNVRGVFERPLEVMAFTPDSTSMNYIDYRTNYPIPADKVPILKEFILKQELGIQVKALTDSRNDSTPGLGPQVEPELMQQRQAQ